MFSYSGREHLKKEDSLQVFHLLRHASDFQTLIKDYWEDVLPLGSPMTNLCKRLRAAKVCCKSLNRSDFSNVEKRSKEAFDQLVAVQSQLLSNPSQLLSKEERQALDNWNLWSAIEESFFMSKSRVRWLKDGDANTKFFYNSLKGNLARNTIHHLRDESDQMITDMDQIKGLVESYYKNLLGTVNSEVRPLSVDQIKALHSFRCEGSLAGRLVTIPTAEEIRQALFVLPGNKAPGPDGFTKEFFTSTWNLVGSDFMDVVTDFFNNPVLLRQVSTTIMALIPKQIGAYKLSDFRPVSCCNMVYKVISMIIASSIKWFLDEVVQSNQVGFVSGRLLCENVLLASELVTNFHKACSTTRGCLQIDLTKAYDNLDWRFIINILNAFELPPQFIKWIQV